MFSAIGMNETGHVPFAWDEEDVEKIIPEIQALMDQGYKFYQLKRDSGGGGDVYRHRRLMRMEDLCGDRNLILRLPDALRLLRAGARVVDEDANEQDTEAPLERGARVRSAREAARGDTLMQRPAAGG